MTRALLFEPMAVTCLTVRLQEGSSTERFVVGASVWHRRRHECTGSTAGTNSVAWTFLISGRSASSVPRGSAESSTARAN